MFCHNAVAPHKTFHKNVTLSSVVRVIIPNTCLPWVAWASRVIQKYVRIALRAECMDVFLKQLWLTTVEVCSANAEPCLYECGCVLWMLGRRKLWTCSSLLLHRAASFKRKTARRLELIEFIFHEPFGAIVLIRICIYLYLTIRLLINIGADVCFLRF